MATQPFPPLSKSGEDWGIVNKEKATEEIWITRDPKENETVQRERFQTEWWAGKQRAGLTRGCPSSKSKEPGRGESCHQFYCMAQPQRPPNDVALGKWFSDKWLSHKEEGILLASSWELASMISGCIFRCWSGITILHPHTHSLPDWLHQARSGRFSTPPTYNTLVRTVPGKTSVVID